MIAVTALDSPSPSALPLEIVERKGIGHPDTICDALADHFSNGLSRFYLERFGTVLHHNVDKALLCGGAARPIFGGGQIIAPIEIHLAGRATCEFEGVAVPINEIAIEGSRDWLQRHLSHLDVQRDVRIVPHIRPTSAELANLFQRGRTAKWLANDTSFGVGFAPLDTLERLVLAVERQLNSPDTKRAHPAFGEDIKVMGARHGDDIALTVACALVGKHIDSLAQYQAEKLALRMIVQETADALTANPVSVIVNAADRDMADGIYLTVTGLSAEAGDDGQVGRGNRVNGLITPYRPMSLEAAAGKNPVSHVGKLYNVIAHRIAHAVVSNVANIDEANCYLLSCIGHPITEPQIFDVKIRIKNGARFEDTALHVREVARTTFLQIDSLWREAINGTLQVW